STNPTVLAARDRHAAQHWISQSALHHLVVLNLDARARLDPHDATHAVDAAARRARAPSSPHAARLTLPPTSSGDSIAPPMNRHAFVTGLGALLAAPLGAGAQQAAKVTRIGLFHVGLDHDPPSLAPLRESLRDLGYEDG